MLLYLVAYLGIVVGIVALVAWWAAEREDTLERLARRRPGEDGGDDAA